MSQINFTIAPKGNERQLQNDMHVALLNVLYEGALALAMKEDTAESQAVVFERAIKVILARMTSQQYAEIKESIEAQFWDNSGLTRPAEESVDEAPAKPQKQAQKADS